MAKSETDKKVGPAIDMRRARVSGKAVISAVSDKDWNSGRMTVAEYAAACEAKTPMCRYQPPLMEAAGLIACDGRAKTQPENWPAKFGTWHEGDCLQAPRLHHSRDIRRRVAEGMLITIPNVGDIVIGDNDTPAVFQLNAQVTGNYRSIIEVAKRKIFAGIDLSKIVGFIQTGLHSEKLENGAEIVWTSSCQWGYLMRGDKRMSYADISKAAAGDGAGITFAPLAAPIVGNPIKVTELVRDVRKAMSLAGTKDEEGKTALDRFGYDDADAAAIAMTRNIQTLQRWSPASLECFGLRSVQSGIPFFRVVTGTVEKPVEMVNMAIGCRLPTAHAVNLRAFNAANKPAEAPKTPKTKGQKKTGKKTGKTPAKKTPRKTRKAKGEAPAADAPTAEATAPAAETVVTAPPVEDTATAPVAETPAPEVNEPTTAAEVAAAEAPAAPVADPVG